MDECSKYWEFADELPLDQVVTYWCEKSGFGTAHCREAKKAAIVKACKDGIVKYKRADGKTFADPIEELAARGNLLIERSTFDTWVEDNFEDESPLPAKPITTNERNSLLTIIAALCDYSAIDSKARGAAAQIAKLTEDIGAPVSDDTVRRALEKIPDALESRMK